MFAGHGNTTAPWGTTYACFRVPTAVQTANGTLVVLTESRIGSCDDQAPKDVTMRRSHDGGRTWSPLQLVVGPRARPPGTLAAHFTARNPYATVLPPPHAPLYTTVSEKSGSSGSSSSSINYSGTILLSWVNSTDANHCVNYQQLSHDHGATWDDPVRVDYGRWEGVLLGPGAGIVLGRHTQGGGAKAASVSPYAGRLVVCGATGYVGGMPMDMVVWTSDDNGVTYQEAGGASPFKALQECQLVELPDGRVMVNARTAHLNKSCDCRATSVSSDGGRTWSAYTWAADLIEPTCSAGLINLNGTLLFSNPSSRTSRVNMTVKASKDAGRSWQTVAQLEAGQAAYSVGVPVSQDKGTFGIVYEGGANWHIRIAVLQTN